MLLEEEEEHQQPAAEAAEEVLVRLWRTRRLTRRWCGRSLRPSSSILRSPLLLPQPLLLYTQVSY
jgi:hypothetical protein